jgi:hypothetical protein
MTSLLNRITGKATDAVAQPVDQVDDDPVTIGRRLARAKDVEPGGTYTVAGRTGHQRVEHIDYRLAGQGRRCLIVHALGNRRDDAVVSLAAIGERHS